jgi:hypothetical protein
VKQVRETERDANEGKRKQTEQRLTRTVVELSNLSVECRQRNACLPPCATFQSDPLGGVPRRHSTLIDMLI